MSGDPVTLKLSVPEAKFLSVWLEAYEFDGRDDAKARAHDIRVRVDAALDALFGGRTRPPRCAGCAAVSGLRGAPASASDSVCGPPGD